MSAIIPPMTFKHSAHSAHEAACVFLFTACLFLTAFACAVNAADDLKAGFAQVDITPPIGGIITGPMGPRSTATDDPLKARAMVVASAPAPQIAPIASPSAAPTASASAAPSAAPAPRPPPNRPAPSKAPGGAPDFGF